MRVKLFWMLAGVYFIYCSIFFLQQAIKNKTQLRFLYPDTATVSRIEVAQAEHRVPGSRIFTRFFYNKPFGYFQTYVDNAYRSVDVAFLFTLTAGSSMYDDQGPMQMLFPWELLFFIPATVFLIRSKNREYIFFLYYLISVIFIAAFIMPPLNQVKLFPEVIGLRLIIIFGWFEGVRRWLRK